MSEGPRLPWLARAVLRMAPLGSRRPEVLADLAELFASRAASHGRIHAARRLYTDVISLCRPRRVDARAAAGGARLMLDALTHDFRYSVRTLWRQPAFTLLAALTLAIGFGANVAVFAVVDRLLLGTPAHVNQADRVFRLHIDVADVAGGRFTMVQGPYIAFTGLRAGLPSFERLSAYRRAQASLGAGPDARPVVAAYADAGYFPLLGVSPALGRFFVPGEDHPPAGGAIAVISHAFWQTALGGQEAALGRDVRIGARAYSIVGVAPAGFTGDTPEPVDVWLPLHAAAGELPANWTTAPTMRTVTIIGRLRAGVTRTAAAAEATDVYRRLTAGTRVADPTARVLLASLHPGRLIEGGLTPEGQMTLWLQGVSLLVLVVAIANVVNLQLTRAAERQRETAVRLAIGAGRARLVRQSLVEAGMLAIAGGAAALRNRIKSLKMPVRSRPGCRLAAPCQSTRSSRCGARD